MGFPRGKSVLAVAPDGLDKLDLFCGVEIAFDLAVTLLDWLQITALLKVVDLFFGHAGAACQYFCHRVELAQGFFTQGGPHLSLCVTG